MISRQSLASTNGTCADRARGNAVALISCVKSKRLQRCKAGEMYTSSLFRKAMAYARRLEPKSIFILSAQYGLLRPDDIIDPYEKTLKAMKLAERRQWAENVISDLRKHCNLETDRFIFLAGMHYRKNVARFMNNYDVPMEGMPFGNQLRWLNERLR